MTIVRHKITAIGAAVLLMLLPLALCCMTAPQHACCKGRCAMAPDAVPVVAIAPAKPRIDVLIVLATPPLRTNVPDGGSLLERFATVPQPRSNPVATIQLRI